MRLNYEDYKESLKETSKDKSGTETTYMIDLSDEVINYDKFMEAYFKFSESDCKGPPASVDALCKIDGSWCFIEFKNGKVNTKEKQGIHNKIGHSSLVLLKNENIKFSEFCENTMFILVYNGDKNNQCYKSQSQDYLEKYILKKADDHIIRFDLKKYRKIYFKEIYTFTEDEFKNFMLNHDVKCPGAVTNSHQ